MTEKITSVSSMTKKVKKMASRSEAEQAAVRELVKAARARGEDLTGPDGLLKSITARGCPRSGGSPGQPVEHGCLVNRFVNLLASATSVGSRNRVQAPG
ncbi:MULTISPECIES: hypothetical protein [Serinicoccus]|uniref:hypothetical protein n=1 Tax=Serinicoccus sp. CUA-874 TaxID=1517939 RepID=UPI000422AF74|nr:MULTISPECIES: hypothetical protein [Serinicoccus]OLT24924.1 hypothetical protein BJF82_13075 [Kytococcus sp. CUA-901]